MGGRCRCTLFDAQGALGRREVVDLATRAKTWAVPRHVTAIRCLSSLLLRVAVRLVELYGSSFFAPLKYLWPLWTRLTYQDVDCRQPLWGHGLVQLPQDCASGSHPNSSSTSRNHAIPSDDMIRSSPSAHTTTGRRVNPTRSCQDSPPSAVLPTDEKCPAGGSCCPRIWASRCTKVSLSSKCHSCMTELRNGSLEVY
jgi:hypothetical protein